MRKIILNLALSLDGYIEGPNGEYDWCFTDQDYGMTEFLGNTDAIFLGRKSYEMLMSASPEVFSAIKMYVFSNTLKNVGDNAEIITEADFKTRIEEIRHQPGANIWLFGGAELVSAFLVNNMINELLISVHPVILGGGKPLFINIKERIDLTLISSEQFSSGLVQLKYTLKPKFDMSMLDNM
ncbi:dihydrofolate reductase family protein [Mucilaginibacter lappiensis]|uniref:Dihydrofolate reductase n=1 Tax=Mucilaginibacter lappiensis TaxID=354630 RepID=A0A1N6ZV54_9SPHI|nr:dihydrofolate reductase family protein [Mucilaginibacter lappiensis]MBB6110334.1 dihydrofolate reductase [Mucilaginibacter lappiensis]MBB6128558.1 dihydrofolate reductase [Mucilaginibacter lappiensis]SIR30695.1 Dihydrofolate reductase [Mucilaginibacter lappiensis]